HRAARTSCSAHRVLIPASVTGPGSGSEQAGINGRRVLAFGAALLATQVAGTLLLGEVLHFPGDHRRQTSFFLLDGQLATIAPLAELYGLLEVFVDFGGDVFDGFDKERHGLLP